MGNLKNRVRVNITLDTDLYEKLKAFSDQSMIPMSRLAERTIGNYLEGGYRLDSAYQVDSLINDFLRICGKEVERAWYRGMDSNADPDAAKDEIKEYWRDEKEDVLQMLRDVIEDYKEKPI